MLPKDSVYFSPERVSNALMSKFVIVFALLWAAVFFFPVQTKSVAEVVHTACSSALVHVWQDKTAYAR